MTNGKKFFCINYGFSLIEIMVAMAFFSFVVLGISGLLMSSLNSLGQSGEMSEAEKLAEEGIEAVRSIRDRAWNENIFLQSSIEKTENGWQYTAEGTSEQIGKYARLIFLEPVYRHSSTKGIVSLTTSGALLDQETRKAIVQVSWQNAAGKTNTLSREAYITNWSSADWTQTDWQSGDNQEIWADNDKYNFDDGSINSSVAGQLELNKVSGPAFYDWTFDSPADYFYATNTIEVSDGNAHLKYINFNNSFVSQNSDFNNTSGWQFHQWNRGWNEANVAGSRQMTGGNPSRYYRINISQGSNDQVGGWVERSFIVGTDGDINTADLNFDWKFLSKSGANPTNLKLYVFIDKNSGAEPVIGQEIWSSQELATSTPTAWANVNLDVKSVVSGPGTYYLKLAFWTVTGSQPSGAYSAGYDNAKVTWVLSGTRYSTDRPIIKPNVSFSPSQIVSWQGFEESAEKNGGEIYYQLSDDDGVNWRYWNGTSWTITASLTNYNTADTIKQNIKNFPVANKKIMFRAFLSSDGYQQINLNNLTVYYNESANKILGNQFLFTGLQSGNSFRNNNQMMSYRFTAATSTAIDQIIIYQYDYSGAGNYRFGLQADNGSGKPSGTYLGSGTNSGNSTGWQTASLPIPVNIVKGSTYHIVVKRETNISKSFLALSPKNLLVPFDNSTDPNLNVLWSTNGGSSWTVQEQTPVFMIRDTGNKYYGVSYHNYNDTNASLSLIYGNNRRGQIFQYTSENATLENISFYVSRVSNNMPEDNLYLSLFDVTDNKEIASTTFLSRIASSRTYAWVSASLPTGQLLEKNKYYRLVLYSPLTSSGRAYHFPVMENINNVAQNSVNYDGTNSYYIYSTNNGQTWTSSPEKDIAFKLGFSSAINGYKQSGFIVSSAYPVTSSVFNAIYWNGYIPVCSPACSIKFQIQTAPDAGGVPGEWNSTWCGPNGDDGNENDFYATSTGSLIHFDHNGDSWIRYKAKLIGDTKQTPVLNEVKINHK